MKIQLFITYVLFVATIIKAAPTATNITNIDKTDKMHPAHKKVGISDVAVLIPGVRKSDVCTLCKRVLSAFKKEGMRVQGQDLTNFHAAVDQECHALTSNAPKFLPLESLEPFCRELGNSIMDLAGTYSALVTGFIDPPGHCERATFCPPSDD